MRKEPGANDTVLTVPERLFIFFSLVAIGFALYDSRYWAEHGGFTRGFLQNDISMLGCCTSSILTIIFWIWAGGISNRHYMTPGKQDSWQSEADNQAAPKEIKPKKKSKTPKNSKKRNKAKRSSKIPSKECEHCGFLNNANNNPNWAMMENPDILTSLVDPGQADKLADLLKGTVGGDILCAKCGYNFWVSADELAGKETDSSVQVDSFNRDFQDDMSNLLSQSFDNVTAKGIISKAHEEHDVELIIEVLGYNQSEGVHKAGVETLTRIGAIAVEPLIEALGNNDGWEVRRAAAEALGEICDERAVKPLIKALEDGNKYVRSHAAWALGEIGDAGAVGSLLELLEDDAKLSPGEDSVQSHAAQALGFIGDARAVEPLIKALGPEPLDDQNEYFRFQCSVALTRFGSAAVAPLIKALGNQSEAVYESAVEALGHIGAVAVDPLIEALDANHPIPEQFVMMAIWAGDKKLDVRRGAARALVMIDDKRAAPSLEKAGFKVLAMWILKDVSGFINALEDDNKQIRRFSAGALYKIGDARAVEPLKKALDDEDKEVREVAKEALRRLEHEVND